MTEDMSVRKSGGRFVSLVRTTDQLKLLDLYMHKIACCETSSGGHSYRMYLYRMHGMDLC